MRPKVNNIYAFIFAFVVLGLPNAYAANDIMEYSRQDTLVKSHKVENGNIGIEISGRGEIIDIDDKTKAQSYAINESTAIEGLFAHNVHIKQEDSNSIKITQTMRDSMGDRSCTVVKKISLQNDAIHVDVKIYGDNYAWTSPIHTKLKWNINTQTKFWTAWGKENKEETAINLDGDKTNQEAHADAWEDPLVPTKFKDLELSYGGKRKDKFVKAFSLPLATILQSDKKSSFNMVFSPKDTIINMDMKTTADGSLVFSRLNDRISPENTVSYSYDFFFMEADWRPVLGWMVKKYPRYFNPSNPRVHEVAGTASYSGYNGDMDVKKYKDIAYGFNWYAVRNWPYLGMFMPPVDEGETWQSWTGFGSGTATKGRTVSYQIIRENHKKMRKRGFHLLEYFNLNEFGYRIKFPYDSTLINENQPLWKESNNLLHQKLKPAMLYTEDNRARFSWNRCVIMDPGHEVYHTYLMGQAKRMVEKIPEFSGICIDRLDWYEGFNYRKDDGVSMVEGKQAWAMPLSLHKIMGPLSGLLHKNNKVIYYNPHLTRLDFAQYFDGIFDEFGDKGNKINLSALLALQKPIVGWIHEQATIENKPDYWMQKYLYLGVYPMAPYPEANHSLEASEWADALFLDYGHIFKVLKGKQWVYTPNVASVENDAAKINVFKTDTGYLVPIVHGDKEGEVNVHLKLKKLFPHKKFKAYVAYPGDKKWSRLRYNGKTNGYHLNVTLKRGMAAVLLK